MFEKCSLRAGRLNEQKWAIPASTEGAARHRARMPCPAHALILGIASLAQVAEFALCCDLVVSSSYGNLQKKAKNGGSTPPANVGSVCSTNGLDAGRSPAHRQ